MNRYFVTLIASGLLAGCAMDAPPPLTADDPASPAAPQAPGHATPDALGIDGLTRKSRQILQPSQEEQLPGMQMPQGPPKPSPTPEN
jgi:hypothetical protein